MRKSFILLALLAACTSEESPINGTGEYEMTTSAKDSRGHWNVRFEFPDQPAHINEGQSYTNKISAALGENCWLYKVDSFNGLDRGDIVEMDTFVYDGSGRALYQRSLHKESPAMYNSFWPIEADAITQSVDIHMHAHVTKADEPARAHWNITLWCGPAENEPPPPPNGNSSDYYTLIRAGVLPPDYTQSCDGATNMVLNLCTQRQVLWHQGYTGPAYALNRCTASRFEDIGLSVSEISDYVQAGEELLAKTDRFITRLPMENEKYPGRSVVNKNIYEPFQADLKAHLAESERHNAATQTDPCREQHDYDNLRGWSQKCCE